VEKTIQERGESIISQFTGGKLTYEEALGSIAQEFKDEPDVAYWVRVDLTCARELAK
jgi:hypothetical protein